MKTNAHSFNWTSVKSNKMAVEPGVKHPRSLALRAMNIGVGFILAGKL